MHDTARRFEKKSLQRIKITLPMITGVLISFAGAGRVGSSGIQNPSAENTTAMNAIDFKMTVRIVEV